MKNNKFSKIRKISAFILPRIIGILFLTACTNNDEISMPKNEISTTNSMSTWQEQLDYVKNSDDNILAKNGMKLVDFEYVGRINSTQDELTAKLEILDEQNLIPLFEKTNTFKFSSISDAKEQLYKTKSSLYPTTHKMYIDTLIKVGMEKVKVNWKYKNKMYVTTCIVSNTKGGFIYDNLMSNVYTLKIEKAKNYKAKNKTPRMKTDEFEVTPPCNGAVSYTWNSASFSSSDIFGTERAFAQVCVYVYGNCNDGIKTITRYRMENIHWTSTGLFEDFSADSSSRSIEATSQRLRFSWGAMTGHGSGLTLGYEGSSFKIPSSAHGLSGEECINADMLH